MPSTHTQVGIVGAGPAGLMLGHLLHLAGIDSVIVENRSEDHVVERVRAGVLEQGTVDLMHQVGVGERLQREGMRHEGIHVRFSGKRHRIDMAGLTGGRAITIYGQNEVVKDLIAARRATGRPLYFDSADVSVHDLDTTSPRLRFVHDGAEHEVTCAFIGGCDGFHGVCRPSMPTSHVTAYEREYPFAWLGILAHAAPASDELVYSLSERGFALFSMRSSTVTRLYLQCAPDEDLDNWSDDRIWSELLARLRTDDGWEPHIGSIVQKGVTPMRSFVVEPMQYGRLFLAGDSAHIVPPTGAKGMNLAFADVVMLSRALDAHYKNKSNDQLENYSTTCLRRVWYAQRFSWWMTQSMHRFPNESAFDRRRQLSDLDYLTSSTAAATSLAEQYVGLPVG